MHVGDRACPLRAESGQIAVSRGMSAWCHKRTHAPQQTESAWRASDIRRTDFMERSTGDRRRQSAMMPTNFTTLPHLSVSSAMNFPKSAGEPTSGVLPRSASRALILGSARPALISLLSFSTISAGVAFGAPLPDQVLAL